jgi:hypothetical protein
MKEGRRRRKGKKKVRGGDGGKNVELHGVSSKLTWTSP